MYNYPIFITKQKVSTRKEQWKIWTTCSSSRSLSNSGPALDIEYNRLAEKRDTK